MNVMIDGPATMTSAVPDAVPGDIETLLRSLVGKLVDIKHKRASDDFHDDSEVVLLDVEVGDVRLLALRRGCPSPLSLLSPREQEIARMVASGYPNKAIASVLEISSWTVASHLRRIFIKLQVSSRAAMVTRLSGSALGELAPARIEAHLEAFSADGVRR